VNFSLIGSILAWGSDSTAFNWVLGPLVVYPFVQTSRNPSFGFAGQLKCLTWIFLAAKFPHALLPWS
jgi:hypothetical protein